MKTFFNELIKLLFFRYYNILPNFIVFGYGFVLWGLIIVILSGLFKSFLN